MIFQTPLQSGDYTKLRAANGNNNWWGRQFITLCKNEVIFAAQIADASNASSIEAFTYHNVSVGAYTDVEIGETIFISHTNDIRDYYWRGRIRKDPTANIVYINETSVNLTADDYLWVVYDFDVWDVLSRMFGTTQYWDWDIAFHPLQPAIVGLQTGYIQYDPAGSTYQIAFDVSASFPTDANSTSSLTYQFTFRAGTYTVVSGSLSTAIVTVDFDADTENWGKLEVTDSQGTVKTRRFYIRNHGTSDPPSLNFSGCQITGSLDSGWNATVAAWDGVDDVLDQTFTVVSNQEYYNGVLGPVSIANNIDMVGRFHRETNEGRGDPTYGYVTSVRFEIEGICTQMQRLEEQDLTTIYKTTATAVDEISLNTPQRSILYYLDEHSTVTRLCDVTFPDGFDTTYLFQYVPNQGGNVLDAIRGIAAQFNGSVEFAPDGRIQVVRDTRFLTDKSGVPVIADWTTADFTTISLPVDPVNKTGRVDAYGATFNASNTNAFRSRAPGSAQGYAAGQSTLDNQILEATSDANAARSELNYRSGQQMAIDNLTVTQDWKATTGGYHFLIPSRGQRVTHTLPTSTNTRGRAYTTEDYWQIISITISHDNASGAREVTTIEELEPLVGDSGDNVPQIAGGTQTNPILLQPLDPFPALPDDPGNYLPDDPTPNPYPPAIPPKTGGVAIYATPDIADTSRNITNDRTPLWTGVTPTDLGGFEIKDVCFDLTTPNPPIGAYLLASDGTDSAIWYTSDVFAVPSPWVEGATFSGVYLRLRSAGTAGSVLVYSPNERTLSGTVNIIYGVGSGPASASVGTPFTVTQGVGGPPGSYQFIIALDQCCTVQWVSGSVDNDGAPGSYSDFSWGGGGLGGCGSQYYLANIPTPPSTVNAHIGETWPASSMSSTDIDSSASGPFVLKITSILGGDAQVRYSNDYGATVGSAVNVGSNPGANGAFDLERVGNASLAAAAGQVKIATTLGGSYSNAPGGTLSSGNPIDLVIPYRRWDHGAVQYSANDSDYLLVGSAAISGASVWKVNGVSGATTDITPAGAIGAGPNLATVWQSSAVCKLAIVLNVSGIYKLYTSVNGGTSWTFRRNVSRPVFLRCRRNDPNGTQLYLIDGSTLYVSLNWGVSWLADTTPSSADGIGMDIYY